MLGVGAATDVIARRGSRRSPDLSVLAPRALPAVIVLVPLALIAFCFWPGHISSDSIAQIRQARDGDFTDQHAPLLMALWYPWYHLGFGPGWVLTLQLVVFGLAAYLLLRAALRPLGAAIATALISLSPVLFGMLGYLSRDVWFTELTLLTFACVLRATLSTAHRTRWTVAALVAAWLALASRQNAGAAIFPALAILAMPLVASRVRPGARRVAGAIGGGIVLTLALMATQIPANLAIGTDEVHPEQFVMMYDVAALSHQNHENLFPRDVMPARGTRPIDDFWNIDSVNSYMYGKGHPIQKPLSDARVSSLRSAWIDAIKGDPLGYLEERWQLFTHQLAFSRSAVWVFHPGIDTNSLGLSAAHPGADRRASDYVQHFGDKDNNGGLLYRVWIYLLAGIVVGALLIRTRRPALVVLGALGLAALTLQAGLFFGTMSTQYRFEFPTIVFAIIPAVVGIAAWRGRARAGTEGPVASPAR